MGRRKHFPFVITTMYLMVVAFMGVVTGVCVAGTINLINTENFTNFEAALPSKLLDVNGEFITEFSSSEKRKMIVYSDLSQNMIDALVTREDRDFYTHRGFKIKAIVRALVGKLTHKSMGGGSTLTQQIAGTLYCDRRDMTIMRKIKELWWAVQMERRFTKQEILEKYLNMVYFGGGTYGVSAACSYYFGHSAQNITPAEAAILVIQLSNPAKYNPFDYPNRARDRQMAVLESMVEGGYITKEEEETSFNDYWCKFDFTRTSAGAYYARDDKAPWFSEYARRELTSIIYGTQDIYTSGLTVNTTVNLSHQAMAEAVMKKYIERANNIYKRTETQGHNADFRTYIPMTEMIAMLFNLPSLKVSKQRAESRAMATYEEDINPIVDVLSLICGIDTLKVGMVNYSNELMKKKLGETTIEGTMVCLDNSNGYIDALVGGSKFDSENQFIRAIQAKVQPGSTFKPLYYSAAIDSRRYTATTAISDTPVVFYTQDGKPYIPQNFRGEWQGSVELWYALAHSMNVPSLKILDGIGFDAAISRAVKLLGIPEDELASRAFVPGYPIGLGVCSVHPIEMARAFSVFANGGKEVTPIAIRTVEDKNGRVILNPEKDIRGAQHEKGAEAQIISPQTAFIMTDILKNTVRSGTLANAVSWGNKLTFRGSDGKRFVMPAAGKTGTTQNWADAWTVGFTPYYTSAFWFGFDKPGRSLGLNITGSTLAGVAWGDFMHDIHEGLDYKDFPRPGSGLVRAKACSVSGNIPTEACGDHVISAWYLEGTQPRTVCELHANSSNRDIALDRLDKEAIQSGYSFDDTMDTAPLSLNLDFLTPVQKEEPNGEEKDSSKGTSKDSKVETITAVGITWEPTIETVVGDETLGEGDETPPPVVPKKTTPTLKGNYLLE